VGLCNTESGLHPGNAFERPGRAQAALDGLCLAQLQPELYALKRPATRRHPVPPPSAALAATHPNVPALLERLGSLQSDTDVGPTDAPGDNIAGPSTPRVLMGTDGALNEAAQHWLNGEHTLLPLRPPGHHAHPDRAERPTGFCFVNWAIVAAELALRADPRATVAIFDADFHRGDGTQAGVEQLKRLHPTASSQQCIYFGTHCAGAFPDAAEAKGDFVLSDTNESVAIRPGRNARVRVGQAWERYVDELLDRGIRPDRIVLSLGVDGDARDPLGGTKRNGKQGFDQRPQDFGNLVTLLRTKFPQAAILVLQEGGYDCSAITEGFAAVTHALRSPLGDA
jgi:acetoin utilization deacetylase AcuC-like enzyme